PRSGDVGTVRVDVPRDVDTWTHHPAALFQQRAIVARVTAECELELRAGEARQGQELHELAVLAPVISLTFQADLAPILLPVTDRRERRAGRYPPGLPQVDENRLTCRQELESRRYRESTVGVAEVLPEREERGVGFEEIDGALRALVQLDLHFT